MSRSVIKEKIFRITESRDDKRSNTLRVEIYYAQGGINYFTYEVEPRGYYFSVSPEKVENGLRSFSSSNAGAKICILEVKRKTKKQDMAAEKMWQWCIENYLIPWAKKYGYTYEEIET